MADHQLTLQFQSHNDPPIVGYLQLLQIYPSICITANYLNEFGLFAGFINQQSAIGKGIIKNREQIPSNLSNKSSSAILTISLTTDETVINSLANDVFSLGW